MSRESNDAFDAYAKREGYKPGTWNYIRAAKAWNAALAWAAEHDDASGVGASDSKTQAPKGPDHG